MMAIRFAYDLDFQVYDWTYHSYDWVWWDLANISKNLSLDDSKLLGIGHNFRPLFYLGLEFKVQLMFPVRDAKWFIVQLQ